MVEFNPRKKTDDKGVGKVNVDNTVAAETPKSGSKTPVIAAAAAGAVVIGLGGYFLLASGGDEPAPTPPVIQHVEPAQPRVIPTTAPIEDTVRTPTRAEIQQAGIRAKESAIYRDSANFLYEAYIGANGGETRRGQDFSVHVSLFERGNVSVLIASGPYAGSRIGFFPAPRGGSPVVTFERVGQMQDGAYGPVFEMLPNAERATSRSSMTEPAQTGTRIRLPEGLPEFSKNVNENGQIVTAFTVIGTPDQDGVFTVRIFNEDYYTIDLNSGTFTVNSVFAYHPDYLERVARECTNPAAPCDVVDVSTIPVVSGHIDVAPAPNRAAEFGRARPRP